ncbi:hypothetical protein ACEQUB_02546 [Ralstonia syzygii]
MGDQIKPVQSGGAYSGLKHRIVGRVKSESTEAIVNEAVHPVPYAVTWTFGSLATTTLIGQFLHPHGMEKRPQGCFGLSHEFIRVQG